MGVIEETPAYCRVVFDYPPFNILDATIFEGLQDLLVRMDANQSLRVVVFESANPDFYLAHFDLTGKTGNITTAVGPSGLPILMDTFVRLRVAVEVVGTENDFERAAAANQRWKAFRAAAAGMNSHPHFGLAESRVFARRETHVTGEDELATAAAHAASDLCDANHRGLCRSGESRLC
jgi:enoyl-CoA hydratase/carnithine racemase